MDTKYFSCVNCYYTGGGIWVYSAKYKDVWIYGGLDNYLGCYSIRGEDIEEKHNCDYEKFTAVPADGEYPTWQDILDSIRYYLKDDVNLKEMTDSLLRWNPVVTMKICYD